ncbi:MAG: hypothetical protein ACK52J_03325 [bacterium]|jgi:hypothetical protein
MNENAGGDNNNANYDNLRQNLGYTPISLNNMNKNIKSCLVWINYFSNTF